MPPKKTSHMPSKTPTVLPPTAKPPPKFPRLASMPRLRERPREEQYVIRAARELRASYKASPYFLKPPASRPSTCARARAPSLALRGGRSR